MTGTIRDQALEITRDYLGPAAERFIDRQISFHMRKNPEDITRQDIPRLAELLKVSIAVLTNDQNLVEAFSQRIEKLAE